MGLDTYVVFANQYDDLGDARADYDAVRQIYVNFNIIDSYDAAILSRTADGKVSILERVEEPTRQGGAIGLVLGLAVGTAFTLFPAAALTAGAAAGAVTGGGALGMGAGALAGHVAGGMKRSDLKDLGELLDQGKFGLIVVAATAVADRVDSAITHAKKRAKGNLKADIEAVKREMRAVHA